MIPKLKKIIQFNHQHQGNELHYLSQECETFEFKLTIEMRRSKNILIKKIEWI